MGGELLPEPYALLLEGLRRRGGDFAAAAPAAVAVAPGQGIHIFAAAVIRLQPTPPFQTNGLEIASPCRRYSLFTNAQVLIFFPEIKYVFILDWFLEMFDALRLIIIIQCFSEDRFENFNVFAYI